MNTYYECYTYERQFQLFVLFPERLCNARNTIRFDISNLIFLNEKLNISL